MEKSSFFRKTKERLNKFISDSFSKALTDLFSKVIFWIILAIISILLFTIAPKLQKPVLIPLYILLILFLSALFGVVVIINTVVKKRSKQTVSEKLVSIQFEGYPRVWRAKCSFDGVEWKVTGRIRVKCSIHDLDLGYTTDVSGFITSICPDCKKEGTIYSDDLDPGEAFHSTDEWDYFYEQVRNRIKRECEKK